MAAAHKLHGAFRGAVFGGWFVRGEVCGDYCQFWRVVPCQDFCGLSKEIHLTGVGIIIEVGDPWRWRGAVETISASSRSDTL
jgi:hypothetical protein